MQEAGTGPRWHTVPLLALLLLLLSQPGLAHISDAVLSDADVDISDNKFLQRGAVHNIPEGTVIDAEATSEECPQDVQLRWMTEVSSSIYATPLITDLFSDGRKDVIVPSFVHYLEVLEGGDGAKAEGWPAFHKSTLHSSPLLYDIDMDGIRDVLVATYDGEVLFFKDNGEQLPDSLTVPRLQVKRRWFEGLNPDPVDHTNPDVKGTAEQEALLRRQRPPAAPQAGSGQHTKVAEVKAQAASNATGQLRPPPAPTAQAAAKAEAEWAKLDPQVQSKMIAFVKQLEEHRKKYGDAAMNKVLKETKERNPLFYTRIMALRAEQEMLENLAGGADGGDPALATSGGVAGAGGPPPNATAGGARQLLEQLQSPQQQQPSPSQPPPQQPPPPNLPLQQQQQELASKPRRLMGVDTRRLATEGETAAAVDPNLELTDEANKDLSEEARESFKVFADSPDAPPLQGSVNDVDDTVDGADIGYKDDLKDEIGPEDPVLGSDGQGIDLEKYKEDFMKGQRDSSYEHYYDEFGEALGAKEAPPGGGPQIAGGGFFADGPPVPTGAGWQGHSLDGDAGKDYDDWGDEFFDQKEHLHESEHVFVDAHILCTPVVADIDGDGHDELVLSVSHFYDKAEYADPAKAKDVEGIDLHKYVAGSVVVFDLHTRQLKWQSHLDLSSDTTSFRAYIYSPPTVVDLDGDGQMEVVLGTSMGFLYVLDSLGRPREGWPKQMGEILGQVLVADLNSDGEVEIFAADTRGSVALFNAKGVELWERHLGSSINAGATAGDLDNDGELEIVFGTASGHIYALRGSSGEDVKNFPFRTRGRLSSPILITRLSNGPSQHLITMSFDGYLYLVDGIKGCAHTVDVGESSYAQVLADDLDGNGKLDLLVSTMNGNVYAFGTSSAYHPLKAWPSQVMGTNGLVARHGYFGVFATLSSRQPRDVAGEKLQVQLEIVDRRALVDSEGHARGYRSGPYNITALLKGVGVEDMKAGAQPVIGVADTVARASTFMLELPCPRTRTTATVHTELKDQHQLHLVDEFSLSFHMHFHKCLKWCVALPLLLMAAAVLAAGPGEVSLPSFQQRRD